MSYLDLLEMSSITMGSERSLIMKGHLIMSAKENKRMLVLDRVGQKQLNLKEAASVLGLSYRQTRRSYKRFGEQGAEGLVHKSRGRPSNRARPPELREKVIKRYQDRYMGFGPTLAAEKLAEDGYLLDHETLRRWLLAQGLWHKSRKRRKHRSRRERRAHFGELVQMDGSHHRWFGADKPSACLINMVDDATGLSLCIMAQEETTAACMQALRLWIKRYWIPKELYTDRKNVFVTDREPTVEELRGQVNQMIREQILSRLAVSMGLDEGDTVIRRRLTQKMDFLFSDLSDISEPSESELQAFLQENRSIYEVPEKVTFSHIYFNTDKRGEDEAVGAVRHLSQRLNANADFPSDVSALGDPFLLPSSYSHKAVAEIRKDFGPEFV